MMIFNNEDKFFYYWRNNDWTQGLGALSNTQAGGDLTGTYPDPQIANDAVVTSKLNDAAVTGTKLAAGVDGDGLNRDSNQDLQVNADGTDIIISGDVLQLATTGVTAGSYGDQATTITVTVDDKGRITGVTEVPIMVSPVGPAGGDLAGAYPDPTIADGAVVTAKIADDAVRTTQILDNTISSSDIAGSAITTNEIADNTIQSNDIGNAQVTLGKIQTGGANQVLTTTGAGIPQYEDKSIFNTSTLASGNIFVGDPGGTATEVTMSGDATITNTGVATIANDAVTTIKILDDNVTLGKIVDPIRLSLPTVLEIHSMKTSPYLQLQRSPMATSSLATVPMWLRPRL